MLVILGQYDPSFTIVDAEVYRYTVSGSEVHILDVGHFALDEQSSNVIRLTDFWQK
jgi:hypothetical protein